VDLLGHQPERLDTADEEGDGHGQLLVSAICRCALTWSAGEVVSKPVPPRGARPSKRLLSVEDVLALVRARGGRATTSRRTILQVLFEAEQHLTAEELATAVQARAPDVHISTVYRNLEELQKLGVLVHSHLGHGRATYQLASTAHAHFLCEICEATIEAPDDVFNGLAKTVNTRLGFSIDPVHFAMLGRCAACQAAPTASA
jgi:Fur family transcriptional regulator, ferric uptake regulator